MHRTGMDPAPSFLFEMDPNDRGNHAQSGALVFPQVYPQNPNQRLSAERSPSKEKPDVHKPRPMEMPRNEVKSYKKKQAVQHFPAQVSPTHALAQASSNSVNFLPAAYPPPLHLQALSPGAVPQFLCPPCSPPSSYWMPPASRHSPSNSFNFSPYMLHPFRGPPEFWCNPGLLLPILSPQMMPIYQTCAADQASGSTQIHVTPASERREGDQRSMNHVKDNPGSEIKITDFPEPSPFWYEELMKEDGFEECMALLDSFFVELLPAQAKETGEEECGEAGALNLDNSSFLEYVDELCSDPDFVSKEELPPLQAGKQGEPSNLTFYSGTRVNRTLFSTPKRVQPTPTARSKTRRSQEDREQTGKSSPEREMECMKQQAKDFVLQNVHIISPVKRSTSTRGEEEKAGAAKIREKTVSARPTKEGKAPLDEGRKSGRSSSCQKSTSAKTSVTTSGSPTARCRKSKNILEGTIWNMRPQIQTSTVSSPKPSLGAGVQDGQELRGERPSLTGSPVKRLREKWEATGERGQSAGNVRMENEQPVPKKARRGNMKGRQSPKAANS